MSNYPTPDDGKDSTIQDIIMLVIGLGVAAAFIFSMVYSLWL